MWSHRFVNVKQGIAIFLSWWGQSVMWVYKGKSEKSEEGSLSWEGGVMEGWGGNLEGCRKSWRMGQWEGREWVFERENSLEREFLVVNKRSSYRLGSLIHCVSLHRGL